LPLTLLSLPDGLSRLPPIRLKSEAELENQKTPEASHAIQDPATGLSDQKEAPPVNANPPPIIVSPVFETQIHVESPVSIEGTVVPIASNASVTSQQHENQAEPAQITPSPVSIRSRSSSPTPVSGDIILPLMIFAVVKANPSHFVSHLLYTQRFRNQRVGGEESYCLVNLMAVADFLENVDLTALGLGESEKKVMRFALHCPKWPHVAHAFISTADLTPIPVHRAALESQSPPVSPEGVPARLRRGVEQQVDAIAGSANKVILGVVDQGFGVLRALLPGTSADAHATSSENPNVDQEAAPWNGVRPGFGLLRRESAFSIASLAASLPRGRDRAKSLASTTGTMEEESGQMMVDVSSRPGSVRSVYGSDAENSTDDDSQEDDGDDDEQERDVDDRHDGRSIRSFENMMGRTARRRRTRKSLSDRLASMPGLSRYSGPQQQQAIQPLVVLVFPLILSLSLFNFQLFI
jgi:Vacuolar sorting protein 9 (VPS9) domain